MLVDVHAHMYSKHFAKDLDKVIKRAENAGVKAIIAAGVDPETNKGTLELAEKYKIIRPALGLYPVDALERETRKKISYDVGKAIQYIKQQKNKIIAISEFGLDYLSKDADKKTQKQMFTKLLRLAKDIKKPVIVHSRKAEADVVDILEKENMKNVVMHCFCGKRSLVKKAADLGYYFSIPCIVTRSEQFQDLVKNVDLKQLLTETDAPYLSPFPDKRNEPAYVRETIKKIAEIKSLPEKQVEKQISANYHKLFVK